jgi:hypothetical protein
MVHWRMNYTRVEDMLIETRFEMAKIEIRLYNPELLPQGDKSPMLSSLPQVSDLLTPGPTSSPSRGLSARPTDQNEHIHAETRPIS